MRQVARVVVMLLVGSLGAGPWSVGLGAQAGQAPLSGAVSDAAWGIRFVIPDGWVGQRAQDRSLYLLGSHTMIGVMMIVPAAVTDVDQLRAQMVQGLHEDGGTALSLTGGLRPFGPDGLAGDYRGTIEWQPARAHAVGRVTGDGGAIVLMATTSDGFTPAHQEAASALARSMVIAAPDLGPVIAEWDGLVRGRMLRKYDRYDAGRGSGGYTSRVTIDLCADGTFFHSDQFSANINVPGATGYVSGDGAGAGRWELAAAPGGQLVLRLRPHEGGMRDLPLGWGPTLPAGGGRYTRLGDVDYLRVPSERPGCAR